MNSFTRIMTATALATTVLAGSAASATEITFYYPIAVGGPITKIVDGYAVEFAKAHPDITVKPVYTGSYQDSVVKAMTAAKAGNAPDVAVLLSTDMFTLIDDDLIEPYDAIATSEGDKTWIKSFYPALMENSQAGGHTWGIPFQRSTIVQYWNKEAFKAAGLDPDKAPRTWDEMVAFGKKLTKRDASGHVSQWGVEIPPLASPIGCSRRSPPRAAPSSPIRMAPKSHTTIRRSSRPRSSSPISARNTKSCRKASSIGGLRPKISSRARPRSCGRPPAT
jgi:sn-glycerol 3-phosphate transport system substrate-binding protein